MQLAADARETLVRQPEPGEVPGVGVARGQLEHPRPLGRDKDRQVAAGRRHQHGVASRDVSAIEVGPPVADQAAR